MHFHDILKRWQNQMGLGSFLKTFFAMKRLFEFYINLYEESRFAYRVFRFTSKNVDRIMLSKRDSTEIGLKFKNYKRCLKLSIDQVN